MLIILFQATPAPPDLPEDETQAHPQDLHTDQNQDKESLSRIALPILFNPGYNMVIVDYLWTILGFFKAPAHPLVHKGAAHPPTERL